MEKKAPKRVVACLEEYLCGDSSNVQTVEACVTVMEIMLVTQRQVYKVRARPRWAEQAMWDKVAVSLYSLAEWHHVASCSIM